eukprot:Platyproteum_vivax@DN7690_c4_g1_i5.p1
MANRHRTIGPEITLASGGTITVPSGEKISPASDIVDKKTKWTFNLNSSSTISANSWLCINSTTSADSELAWDECGEDRQVFAECHRNKLYRSNGICGSQLIRCV